MNIWEEVARERVELSDLLDACDPSVFERPSLCAGWRVHDVIAHLVSLAEAPTGFRYIAQGLRSDFRPMKSVDKIARRLAVEVAPRELTARLRDARHGQFRVPGLPSAVVLGETLVHRADISEAAGLPPHPADEALRTVLKAELRLWPAFGVSPFMQRRHWVPTDGDWTLGPSGGQRIEAPGEELLRIATGRKKAVPR